MKKVLFVLTSHERIGELLREKQNFRVEEFAASHTICSKDLKE